MYGGELFKVLFLILHVAMKELGRKQASFLQKQVFLFVPFWLYGSGINVCRGFKEESGLLHKIR